MVVRLHDAARHVALLAASTRSLVVTGIILRFLWTRQMLHHDLVSAGKVTSQMTLASKSRSTPTHVKIVNAELGTVRMRLTPIPR